MTVTVFARRAMEDCTAKLLLEKVSFFHVAPLHVGGVCICMCLCACACTYGVEYVYLNQNTAMPWIIILFFRLLL